MKRKTLQFFLDMKNYITSINRRNIITSVFCIVILLIAYCTLNYSNLIEVYNLEKEVSAKTENMKLVVGGEAVGIKLLATGVLIVGIDRDDTTLKIGDVILEANSKRVETNSELIEVAQTSEGKAINIKIDRQNEIIMTNITPIKDDITGEYKLSLWVKDSSAGVGTITFYDKVTGKFAALGHGVTETKENYILPITAGGITKTNIYSIKKGISRSPGELKGVVSNDIVGDIAGNTDKGIYGSFSDKSYYSEKKEIEILQKTKVKEGKASIKCTLDDNTVKEYSITIEKVLLTSTGNKNMIIKITDQELINKTGGIVQGMSGSPILQNGKLVGAVTHVFLNDPTKGYGVFIENMINDMSSIN